MIKGFLQPYFSCQGRMAQWEFFKRYLAVVPVVFIIGFLLPEKYQFLAGTSVTVLAFLTMGITCQRLHDISNPGWTHIIYLLPMAALSFLGFLLPGFNALINPPPQHTPIFPPFFSQLLYLVYAVYFFKISYLLVVNGKKGENKYGRDPLAKELSHA